MACEDLSLSGRRLRLSVVIADSRMLTQRGRGVSEREARESSPRHFLLLSTRATAFGRLRLCMSAHKEEEEERARRPRGTAGAQLSAEVLESRRILVVFSSTARVPSPSFSFSPVICGLSSDRPRCCVHLRSVLFFSVLLLLLFFSLLPCARLLSVLTPLSLSLPFFLCSRLEE